MGLKVLTISVILTLFIEAADYKYSLPDYLQCYQVFFQSHMLKDIRANGLMITFLDIKTNFYVNNRVDNLVDALRPFF